MGSRRVLVTGGAGFIGSHLVDGLIRAGHRVVIIDNETTGTRAHVHAQAEYVVGDVTHPEDLDPAFRGGLDAVFHVAGQASVMRSFADPEADLWINVLGTVNVLKKMLESGVPRLLYASSMTVYGEPARIPTSEDDPALPVSYYGISKYAAERYVHATSRRPDLIPPLAVTSLRMFSVFGPRQSLSNPYQGVVAIFAGNVLRREPITIHSDGEQTRDFVHIDDVVRAWLLAFDSPDAVGQVINVGSGIGRSINDIASVVLSAFGETTASYPVVYAPTRPGDQRRVTADINRARHVLGWEPAVPFEDGMRDAVQWAISTSQQPSRDRS